MSKYSPRPWRVGMRYGNNRTEINDAHGNAVATVWTHDVKRIDKPAGSAADYGVNERGMANAVIIAASPELLEACRAVLQHENLHDMPQFTGKAAAEWLAVRNLLASVVAKVGDIATADVTDEN